MIQKVIKLLNIRKQYLNKIVNRLLCGDIMSDELKITIYKWLINSEWHIHNELISIRNDFDRRSFHNLQDLNTLLLTEQLYNDFKAFSCDLEKLLQLPM